MLSGAVHKFEKPKICLIDFEETVIQGIAEAGFNVQTGTLGTPVNVPNRVKYSYHLCLPNYDWPPNLHEFDVFIVDMKLSPAIDYVERDHDYDIVKSVSKSFIKIQYPQTLFNPRPLTAYLLQDEIKRLCTKFLVIVFSAKETMTTYDPVKITKDDTFKLKSETHSNYMFSDDIDKKERIGKEVLIEDSYFANLLKEYKDQISYEMIFKRPNKWSGGKWVPMDAEEFQPLIYNIRNEIVSFVRKLGDSAYILFPGIQDKLIFLKKLLQNYLPGLFPTFFPYNTQFQWLEFPEYQVPGALDLIQEKVEEEKKFFARMKAINEEIANNYHKFKWLHDLITQTGDELVSAVENFFGWLGFSNVRNMDKLQPQKREEDLQIDTEEGLLIVEVKGIGGTSTDDDCRQIGKIKWRRQQERQKFDVFALYVVNHQRFLPPLNRDNPPFTEQQVEDAKLEERGLLTTFDLFNLYFDIENGFISKDDSRRQLLKHGLIKFTPSDHVSIGKPRELHYGNTVVICLLVNVRIKKGDNIIVRSEKFERAKIMNIQLDGNNVEEVANGEVGIQLDRPVTKDTELYVKLAQ